MSLNKTQVCKRTGGVESWQLNKKKIYIYKMWERD